jgi:peroxiredoxin Q/BCP
MLTEGQKAPDFSVSDHDGKDVRLSDYAGMNLLLWFYPKADTPG